MSLFGDAGLRLLSREVAFESLGLTSGDGSLDNRIILFPSEVLIATVVVLDLLSMMGWSFRALLELLSLGILLSGVTHGDSFNFGSELCLISCFAAILR